MVVTGDRRGRRVAGGCRRGSGWSARCETCVNAGRNRMRAEESATCIVKFETCRMHTCFVSSTLDIDMHRYSPSHHLSLPPRHRPHRMLRVLVRRAEHGRARCRHLDHHRQARLPLPELLVEQCRQVVHVLRSKRARVACTASYMYMYSRCAAATSPRFFNVTARLPRASRVHSCSAPVLAVTER